MVGNWGKSVKMTKVFWGRKEEVGNGKNRKLTGRRLPEQRTNVMNLLAKIVTQRGIHHESKCPIM